MIKPMLLNAPAITVFLSRLYLRRACIGLVLTTISFCLAIAGAAGAAPGPPKAETLAADQISSDSARLNAAVNPSGAETISCTFEYGVSPILSMSMPCAQAPEGDTKVPISAVVSGLAPATHYDFRIALTTVWFGPGGTESATATGAVVSFSTLSGGPAGPGSTPVAPLSPAPPQVGYPTATQDAAPNDGEIICAKAGPPGYLITERTNFKRCGRFNTFGNLRERRFFNGIRVYRPKDNLISCRAGADGVPGGYVVTEMFFYSSREGRGKCGPALSVTYDEYRINALRSGVVMCNTQGVPEEFVITANIRSRQCGPLYGDSDANARRISLPHNGMSICDNSRMPPGYVITEVERRGEWLRFGECGIVFGNKEYNAYRIETPPRDGMVICDKARVPQGFLITEVQALGEPGKPGRCGILFGNKGYNGYRISQPHNGLVICDKSRVPVGWVPTERQRQGGLLEIGKCGVLLGAEYNAYRINRPENGTIVCGASSASIPDGYVVTARWSSTAKCPSVNSLYPFHAQQISRPQDGMIICGHAVPDGYVTAERFSETAKCPKASGSLYKYSATRIGVASG